MTTQALLLGRKKLEAMQNRNVFDCDNETIPVDIIEAQAESIRKYETLLRARSKELNSEKQDAKEESFGRKFAREALICVVIGGVIGTGLLVMAVLIANKLAQ